MGERISQAMFEDNIVRIEVGFKRARQMLLTSYTILSLSQEDLAPYASYKFKRSNILKDRAENYTHDENGKIVHVILTEKHQAVQGIKILCRRESVGMVSLGFWRGSVRMCFL